MALLEIKGLRTNIKLRKSEVKAVDNVSFTIAAGETVGLVGESGSGKTTLGRAIVQMVRPTRGRVLWEGVDLAALDERGLRPYRPHLQMVFQDPYEAMNPRLTIRQIIAEPLRLARVPGAECARRVASLLDLVGLDPASLSRMPRELSGGQRQRVGLARALATGPALLVLDEPTSGLDASLQARILNLLRDIQDTSTTSYLFIGHDLAAVSYLARRIIVLWGGHIVEQGPAAVLVATPAHPYTAALLRAAGAGNQDQGPAHTKERPPATRPGGIVTIGCVYARHCPRAQDLCWAEGPPFRARAGGHSVACHYPQDTDQGSA